MPIFGETNQTQLKLLNIKELDFVSLGAGEVSHTLKKKAEVCLPGATEGGFPEAIKANPIRASEAALPEAIKVDPSEAFEAGSTGACEFIYSSVNEVDTTGKSESLILVYKFHKNPLMWYIKVYFKINPLMCTLKYFFFNVFVL